MIYQYSVIVQPSLSVIEDLKQRKKEFEHALGKWYHGVNSEAHISLFNFIDEDRKQIHLMKKFLSEFCKNFSPVSLRFDHSGRMKYSYCVFPDKKSNKFLAELIKEIQKRNPVSRIGKGFPPHMSIGIELLEEDIVVAESIFQNREFNYEFLCDGIVIRRRNLDSDDHYEFLTEVKFTGKTLLLF